jgi:hypothetical protein
VKRELHFFDEFAGAVIQAINFTALTEVPEATAIGGGMETLAAVAVRRLRSVEATEFFERIRIPQNNVVFGYSKQPRAISRRDGTAADPSDFLNKPLFVLAGARVGIALLFAVPLRFGPMLKHLPGNRVVEDQGRASVFVREQHEIAVCNHNQVVDLADCCNACAFRYFPDRDVVHDVVS